MVCSKSLSKSNLLSRAEIVAEFNVFTDGQKDKVASLEAGRELRKMQETSEVRNMILKC